MVRKHADNSSTAKYIYRWTEAIDVLCTQCPSGLSQSVMVYTAAQGMVYHELLSISEIHVVAWMAFHLYQLSPDVHFAPLSMPLNMPSC